MKASVKTFYSMLEQGALKLQGGGHSVSATVLITHDKRGRTLGKGNRESRRVTAVMMGGRVRDHVGDVWRVKKAGNNRYITVRG